MVSTETSAGGAVTTARVRVTPLSALFVAVTFLETTALPTKAELSEAIEAAILAEVKWVREECVRGGG